MTRLLREQVDMQFADLRVLLRLPEPSLDPDVAGNFASMTILCSALSGFSVWFFHTAYATRIQKKEAARKLPPGRHLSADRFKGFVRAYYPRAPREPSVESIARVLYECRNSLVHSFGLDESKGRPRTVYIVAPREALSLGDVHALETDQLNPFAGAAVTRNGNVYQVNVHALYWATHRMLARALTDRPFQCEARADALLKYLPTSK